MEFSNLFDDISSAVDETNNGLERVCRNTRRNYDDEDEDDDNDHDEKFKSKNLKAERKRREKLKSRMLELRSLNKETIITDAIDYIKELRISVMNLSNELLKMEAETPNEPSFETIQIQPLPKMNNWVVESEVVVTRINENKLWTKMVFEKKIGGFTKLIEAMSVLGIELVDTSVTTIKGAVLVTSCIEGTHGKMLVAEQVQEVLADIVKVI